MIRFPETLSDVSFSLLEQMDDVGSRLRSGRNVRPSRNDSPQAFVQEYRSRFERLLCIEDRRQLLVFHINEIEGFGGSLVVHRRNCGDRIADKTNLVQCDRRLVLDDKTEIGIDMIADQIIASEYGSYSRKTFSLRSINF